MRTKTILISIVLIDTLSAEDEAELVSKTLKWPIVGFCSITANKCALQSGGSDADCRHSSRCQCRKSFENKLFGECRWGVGYGVFKGMGCR